MQNTNTTETYTLTNEQAANLLTAASIRDMLSCRGGVALTDHVRDQHVEQLEKVEANIPADLARAALEAVASSPEKLEATAMFAWIRKQNVAN